MPFLELPSQNVRLAYEVHGDSGSPVILPMGLGFPATAWKPQIPALRARHRVLTFDNRGVGKTEARPGLYRMERFADDAVALLDHLGWADAHWAGISMGGMISQTAALIHRERVRSLTLLCTHGGGFFASMASPRAHRWLIAAQSRKGDRRLRALQELLFSSRYLRHCDRNELSDLMRPALGRRVRLRYTLSQLHAIFRFRALKRLGRLAELPTLIVQGQRDILIHPRESEKLHRAIPNSRLVSFPDGAHGITYQLADSVNRLLLAHFDTADRKRRAA